MQRLLTKRDKHGSHQRSKSSEPGSKVNFPPNSASSSLLHTEAIKITSRKSSSLSLFSICAAFLDPNGRCSPNVETRATELLGTITDSIHGFIQQPRPVSGHSILALLKPPDRRHDADKKQEKEDAKKVQVLKQRLIDNNISGLDEAQIEYALQTKYANRDTDRAYEMLVLFQESVEGIVRPYDPKIHMLGAENRGAVTCYLDSLLFAMFARLGSFEPILYTHFEDEPRRRLSTLIRLWVNMLRTGKLIQTDITQHLQEALAACGWEEAAQVCQQDTSEAFGFITEKLQLPLLTMEMDIFHEGKGDAADDHKFINERLLEVAIPQQIVEGRPIRLEDCLEEYFNARVEVVRRLDRRNTLQLPIPQSTLISGLETVDEKEITAEHVKNIGDTSLLVMSPAEERPGSTEHPGGTEVDTPKPMTPVQPVSSTVSPPPPTARQRSTSIIRRVLVQEEAGEGSASGDTASIHSSIRKASLRKEVLMPAWQFFRIIRPTPIYLHLKHLISHNTADNAILIGNTAWYTAQIPTNDAQVAAHFNSTRPVLGICLKRYAFSSEGHAIRQNTAIDIPLQIALPHFIQDDKASDDGPLFGSFNLVLQSAVCHRGTSVHAGHYISLIRGTAKTEEKDPNLPRRKSIDSELPAYSEDQWIKFDDLAPERVAEVDIEKFMETEMPYLLFYQVQPICPDEPPNDPLNRPPSYQDSGIGMIVQEATPVVTTMPDPFPQSNRSSGYFDGQPSPSEEPARSRISFSDDAERPRKSLNLPDSSRRGSLANTDASTVSLQSVPVTPVEETTSSRLSRAASRFGRRSANGEKSKSRPSSHVDENRISATFSRLGLMGNRTSKEPLNRAFDSSTSDVLVTVMSVATSTDDTIKISEKPTMEMDGHVLRAESLPQSHSDPKHARKDKGKLKSKSADVVDSRHDEHHVSHKGKEMVHRQKEDRECVLM